MDYMHVKSGMSDHEGESDGRPNSAHLAPSASNPRRSRCGHPISKAHASAQPSVIRTPSGEIKATGNLAQGILTGEQNAITEYHNRLAEFVRLRNTATPDALATEFQGIETWRIRAENKVGLGRGDNTITRWAKKYSPDLPDLEALVRAAGFDLRPRTRRW